MHISRSVFSPSSICLLVRQRDYTKTTELDWDETWMEDDFRIDNGTDKRTYDDFL